MAVAGHKVCNYRVLAVATEGVCKQFNSFTICHKQKQVKQIKAWKGREEKWAKIKLLI